MSSAPLLGVCEPSGESGETKRRSPAWLRRRIDTEEAWAQLQFAVPMVLTNMSYYAIPLVSVMFSGHLGNVHLAGATLGNSWATVTGYAFVTGMSGAMETLCGQAYGARMYRLLGLYLQSSLIMSAVVSVLISVLWLFTESILLCLHQEPEVSHAAAVFIRYQVPGLFAYSFLLCLLRYLQTQSIVVPLVVCSMVPFVLHIAVNHLLVNVAGLGLTGASLAISATFWFSCLMMLAYVMWSKEFDETWKGFSADAFNYVLPTIMLAMPSAIMVCLEYWAIELLVLIAGLLPNSTASTSLIAICASTQAISYMITYGFSATVSTRVSNEIGAGNMDRAKNSVTVTMKLPVFLALLFILLLIAGHGLWASLFTGSVMIAEKFTAITPLLMISIVLDSAQGVLSGVARGCGWQHLAATTNLVGILLRRHAGGHPLGLQSQLVHPWFMVGSNHRAGVPDQRDGDDHLANEMVKTRGCDGEKSEWLCHLIDICMLFQDVIYDQTVVVHVCYGSSIFDVRLTGFCEMACVEPWTELDCCLAFWPSVSFDRILEWILD